MTKYSIFLGGVSTLGVSGASRSLRGKEEARYSLQPRPPAAACKTGVTPAACAGWRDSKICICLMRPESEMVWKSSVRSARVVAGVRLSAGMRHGDR